MREIVKAIFYILRGGIARRLLPNNFPPWRTVYGWFMHLRDQRVLDNVNHFVDMQDRERSGREASPTSAVIDSQSVKRLESGGIRGFDAGKCDVPSLVNTVTSHSGVSIDSPTNQRSSML
jgi:putative transposase